MNESEIDDLLESPKNVCLNHGMKEARHIVEGLAIPQFSLGCLHELYIKLASIRDEALVEVNTCSVIVFSADHGVSIHNVSAFPSEVTRSNTVLMLQGGAFVAVLAKHLNCPLTVLDIGIRGESLEGAMPEEGIEFLDRRVAHGTKDITSGQAMTRDEMLSAIRVGYDIAYESSARFDCLVLGEMGIGNTTSAASMTSALLAIPAKLVTGTGSGVNGLRLSKKRRAVSDAVKLNTSHFRELQGRERTLMITQSLGGLEIAAMVGAFIGGARQRRPILVDGFIAILAAYVARQIAPWCASSQIFCSASTEPGARVLLDHMEQKPLLDIGMRLGEGTAALLSFPILQAAMTQSKIAQMRDLSSDNCNLLDTKAVP